MARAMNHACFLAVVMGLLFTMAGHARSDIIVQQVNFNVSGWTDYEINQFDPTLGSLTGVQVTINPRVSIEGEFGVFESDLSTEVLATVTVGVSLGVSAPGFSFQANPSTSEFGDFGPSERDYVGNDGWWDSVSSSVSQADLGAYVGGGTIDFSASYLPYTDSSNSSVYGILLTYGYSSGSIDVTYTYTEFAAAPELSSASMVVFASLSVGAVVVLRQRCGPRMPRLAT